VYTTATVRNFSRRSFSIAAIPLRRAKEIARGFVKSLIRLPEGISRQILPKTPTGNCAERARLEALWIRRLAHQMVSLPPIEQVFRALRWTLRQADLP